jgi:tRNA U34 5-carboxymethylaminomethyl modifying GTPase MnmE/TrmE
MKVKPHAKASLAISALVLWVQTANAILVGDETDLPADSPAIRLDALGAASPYNAVGEIVGKTTTEDLLDSIFSQFCLGK